MAKIQVQEQIGLSMRNGSNVGSIFITLSDWAVLRLREGVRVPVYLIVGVLGPNLIMMSAS